MQRYGMIALIAALAIGSQLATADNPPAMKAQPTEAATMKDIEQTLGFVPQFLKDIPGASLPMFWNALKALQMNPDSKLDAKTKALIGVAVAAQVPCKYCIEFHRQEAKAAGASTEEIAEAIGIAATTRMGSTLLNGIQTDENQFRKDVDRIMRKPKQQASAGATNQPR